MTYSFKTGLVLSTTLLTGFAVYVLGVSQAYGQVESATQTADPSRVGQDLLDTGTLPSLLEKVEIENVILQEVPEGAEDIKFVLNGLQIEGVGVYTAGDLDPIYRDQLGATVSLASIYGIARAVTNKYRNDGYILTQVVVPPQTIEDGVVTLRVVEGFVDQIFIQGEDDEGSLKQIRKYAENVKAGDILNAKSLERYLLLINDLPGVKARGILSPSQTTVGASDLTLVIERDPYEAEVGFDNHGSRYLGPYQISVSGSANSRFGLNERIAGQFVLGGDKDRKNELLFGSMIYEQPVDRFGSLLRLVASITSTEPGADLRDFDVHGLSKYFSATLTRPFIRSRTTNFYGRATFDVRNVDSRNNIEPSRQDKIRSIRLGTTLQFMDTLVGIGVNAIDLEFSQGIDGLGASNEGDPQLTRAAGDPEYTKGKLQLQRLQRLTPKLNILLAGEGQLAAAPLLSSEEFGIGGMNIGRGYDASEIVGEDGIAGKAELQWNNPYALNYVADYQIFGFYDVGTVWNKDATTSAAKRESIASTGLGVRAEISDKTTAGVAVAFPLTRHVDARNDRDPRYYFNISHKF